MVGLIDNRGVAACRSLLDFTYLAQYPSHDDETLDYMKSALEVWERNKGFFLNTGVRDDFNIPKLHSLLHYVDSIRMLGATDNFNTEMFERLHIDFAKAGWRASNKRDHFPQMVKWLSQREKVSRFESLHSYQLDEIPPESDEQGDEHTDDNVDHDLDDSGEQETAAVRTLTTPSCQSEDSTPTSRHQTSGQYDLHKTELRFLISKRAPERKKPLSWIAECHGAPHFVQHLKEFLNELLPKSRRIKKKDIAHHRLPFDSLDVWHRLRLRPSALHDGEMIEDVIKAVPPHKDSPARFDTAVALNTDCAEAVTLTGRQAILFHLAH
jgi:hypothetical protein